jgi:hypothetical protein
LIPREVVVRGEGYGILVLGLLVALSGCAYSRLPTRDYSDPEVEPEIPTPPTTSPVRDHYSVRRYRMRHGQLPPPEPAEPAPPHVRSYQEEYGFRYRMPREPLGATTEFWFELAPLHIASGSARSRGVDHLGGGSRESGAHSPVHSVGIGFARNLDPSEGLSAGFFGRAGTGGADAKSSGWWEVNWFNLGPRLSMAYGHGGNVYLMLEGGAMFWNGRSTSGRGPRSYQGPTFGMGVGGIVQFNRTFGMGVEVLYRRFTGNEGFDANLIGGSLIWRFWW